MKIIFIDIYFHHKNKSALLSYNNQYHICNVMDLDNLDLSNFDAVYSPSIPIDVTKYPNTKFIFGPHFNIFPNKHQMDMIRGNNSIYIFPSEWTKQLWKQHHCCDGVKLYTIPFGVDTERFNETIPLKYRTNVFIYFKRRNPQELDQLIRYLNGKNINARIFNYVSGYNENDYLNFLNSSRFGIWLGAHESQGFALQEALSCNIPLLVWNISSMNQEHGSGYSNIPATTIPYWDDRCGRVFNNISELDLCFNEFIKNLENYRPREYILENLSINKCQDKFEKLVNEM